MTIWQNLLNIIDWRLYIIFLCLNICLLLCLMLYVIILVGLTFYKYLSWLIIHILNLGYEILVMVFPIWLIVIIPLIIVLLQLGGEYDFGALSNQLSLGAVKSCYISITKNGLIFYLVSNISYASVLFFLFMEQKDSPTWYLQLGSYMAILHLEFWILFTDSFLLVCGGHILVCCIVFFGIFVVLWWDNKVKVPIWSWIGFVVSIILVGGMVGLLYLRTGVIFWSISQGSNLANGEQMVLQSCFYFVILFPVGLFPGCTLVLGNCKSIPNSFRTFFNTTFFLHCFWVIIRISELFRDAGFNYIFFIILCVTISTIFICLYFETDFIKIINLSAMAHFHFLVAVYILDNTALQNGLFYDLWIHILCLIGFTLIVTNCSRSYKTPITTAIHGLVYKYPCLVLVNIILVGLFERGICRFIYQVYLDFNWIPENMIFFTILLILIISLILYWIIMAWRWCNLWFKVPNYPDIQTPKYMDELYKFALVFIVVILVLSFLYPAIFYW